MNLDKGFGMKDLFAKVFRKMVNRETILYVIFGVFTSVINIALFDLLLNLNWEYKIANLVTLIVVKVTAYLCNKLFVFRSKCENLMELLKEIVRYVFARGATMLIDYFGLIVLVDFLALHTLGSKIFITIVVVILNYVLGKKHVFKH